MRYQCIGRRIILNASAVAALFVGWMVVGRSLAVERVYNLVTNQSNIAISGSVTNSSLGTAQIQAQGPGGLTTTYSGTIKTDRSPGSITFLSGSVINANVNGNWQPLPDGNAGTFPGDYGAKVSYLAGFVVINVAARDFVGDLSSPATTVSGGSFGLSSTNVTFTNGSVAFRSSTGTQSGSQTVIGQGGPLSGTGMLTTSFQNGDTLETLKIPVNSTFTIPVDASTTVNLTLMGQLLASAIVLSGDYNQNGVVDGADYVVWRNNNGSAADYNKWRSNFGNSYAPGAGSGSVISVAAIPETSGAMLLLIAALVDRFRGRRLVPR
jgi:hypothetical protein